VTAAGGAPRVAVVLGLVGLAVGCHTASTADDESAVPGDGPLVFAAASMTHALEEAASVHAERTGQRVRLVFGASGNLAAQIRQGAPADLFLSADPSFVERLHEADVVQRGSAVVYAVGRLALIVPPGRTPPGSLRGLHGSQYAVVALASPDHAPYGRAAREALHAAGLWPALQPRVVIAANVAAAAAFVRTGNADAGLVAAGLVRGGGADAPALPVPDSLHTPLLHMAALTVRGRDPEGARRFLAFLRSASGQDILTRHGFGRAPADEVERP